MKTPELLQKHWDYANQITGHTVVGKPAWINKFPKKQTSGKTELRLLVVGKYNIFTVKTTITGSLKIAKTAHIYDVAQMGHVEGQDNVIEIVFLRDTNHLFDIRFANTPSASIDQSVGLSVLFTIQYARMQISYKFPAHMLHYIPARSLDMLAEMPRPWERMLPAQAHVETYHATCTYLDHHIRQDVITHVFTQLQGLLFNTDVESGDFEGRTMDLSACFKKTGMLDKDVHAICSIIAHSPWFNTITANTNPGDATSSSPALTLTASSTGILFAAIANKHVVHTIRFPHMSLTAARLGTVAAMGGSVKILDLSRNPLTDDGIGALAKAFVPEDFDEDDYTCALSELYLAKCSIKAGPGFSTLCANVLPTTMASSLRIFDLANNPLGKGGSDSLSLFLSLTQSLESLNIVNTNVDLHIVLEPLRLNNRLWTTLTTLDISNNPFSEDAAINLGGFLKRSNVIKSVNVINMTTLTAPCYSAILSNLFSNTSLPPALSLDLSRNKMIHSDVAAISNDIETAPRFPISNLYMNFCGLGVEGMSLVAQSIVERKPNNLKVFEAQANLFTGFFTSSSSIHACQTALIRLIKSSEPLTHLNLSGGDGNKFGEHIIDIAEKGIKHSKTLLAVDVSDHKAGDKLAFALASVVEENEVLRQITFDRNQVTAEGFKALANGAKDNKTLLSIGPPVRDFARAERVAATKEAFNESRDAIEAILSSNAKERKSSTHTARLSASAVANEVDAAEEEDGINVVEVGNRQRSYSKALQRQKSQRMHGGAEDDEEDETKEEESAPSKECSSSASSLPTDDDDDDEAMRELLAKASPLNIDSEDAPPPDDRSSLIQTTRSSMEEKLQLLQLARLEADDVRKEMEEKLLQSKQDQEKAVAEAKSMAEEAMREAIRAEMGEEMKATMEGEIKAAKEAAIAEAGKEAASLQALLLENEKQVAALTEGAEVERQKLEERLNEKAEKELKEQMMILKKATGMAEAELQWAIESSNGNSFLMAEEKKEFHELEYSKLMFEMSKLDKVSYLLKNPNIGRALVSASKAIAEERIQKKDDDATDAGKKEEAANPIGGMLAKQMSARAPPPFFAAAAAGLGALPLGKTGGGKPGGAGFLSQLTGGAKGGGTKGKAVLIKDAREKLKKLLVTEQKQVDSIPFKLKDFCVIVDALKAVIDASDEDFAKVAKERNDQLKEKDKQLKLALLKVQQGNQKHEGEIEVWSERMNTAPERAAELVKREDEWLVKQTENNEMCRKVMRTLLPPDIAKMSTKQYLEKVKVEGGLATYALAERLKTKKMLHWIVMYSDDIARENFLTGANVQQFKNISDYDIVELRAIYASLPPTFELDSTPGKVGQKLEWKNALVAKLKAMGSQQDGDTVDAGWDPVKEEVKKEKLKPLEISQERNSAYYYAGESVMKKKIEHFEEIEERLVGLKKRIVELEGGDGLGGELRELKEEKDAALEDARSEYLQNEYGKEVLKSMKVEAEKEWKKAVDELGVLKVDEKTGKKSGRGLKMKTWLLEESISNASPSKAELKEEFAKIRSQVLEASDAASDAAMLCGSLEVEFGVILEKFCGFELGDERGQMVPGLFDGSVELKKRERLAFKKLSDEEEVKQRKLDLVKAMAARDANAPTAKTGLVGGVNNGADVDVSEVPGAGSLGKVKVGGSMRAMLESQHGTGGMGSVGGAKKEKKEPEKRAPRSKKLIARSSQPRTVLLGAGEGGGGTAAGAGAEAEVEEVVKPVNPMLAALAAKGGATGGAPARPPNPMLAALQARGGGAGAGAQARPPNPMLAALQARGPRPPSPMVGANQDLMAALASRNAGASEGVGEEVGMGARRPPRPPMGGMFAEIAARQKKAEEEE